MRKPDFFIVGAPRCGTTAMRTYLEQHPEIFLAHDVEPHFFGTDLSSPRFIRDEQDYLALFALADQEKRVGEKSPWYLYSKRAALEIKEFQPSARIIIMLRNPVDMLYSLHSHHFNHGYENLADFEAALDAEEDRKRGLSLPDSVSPSENWLFLNREIVKYAEQVKRYSDAFGREKVHITIFDDFICDTAGAYEATLRFLAVNPNFQTNFRKTNPSGRLRSRTLFNPDWDLMARAGVFRPISGTVGPAVGEWTSTVDAFNRLSTRRRAAIPAAGDTHPLEGASRRFCCGLLDAQPD